MATKTIAWTSGSGNITLTYTGQGNGAIEVSSDENDLFEDREQSFNIITTNGTPEQALSILVKQAARIIEIGTVFDFPYTGSVQQVTLPKGKYKLQCWGAQGGTSAGSSNGVGSKGGYSEGIITLAEKTTLYVFVGGQGSRGSSSSLVNGGWNGGGASVGYSGYNSDGTNGYSYPACGGGATDISTVTSDMSYSNGRTNRSSASLLARCIVAGGGAGGSYRYTSVTTTSSSWETESTLSHYSKIIDSGKYFNFYKLNPTRSGKYKLNYSTSAQSTTSSSTTTYGTSYWDQGSYELDGSTNTSPNRIRMKVSVSAGDVITISPSGGQYWAYHLYNSSGTRIGGQKSWQSSYGTVNISTTGYIGVAVCNTIDGSISISPSGLNTTVQRIHYTTITGSLEVITYQVRLKDDSSLGPLITYADGAGEFNVDLGTYPTFQYHHFIMVRAANYYVSMSGTSLIQVSSPSTSNSSGYSNQSQQGGGTSGKGQYPGSQTSAGTGGGFGYGANQTTTNYRYDAGAGGGGWYGGGTNHSDSSTNYVNYSGGGSGFVNTAANASSRPSGYTGLQLDSGTTTAGNTSHPSTSGGTETGHSGNGYARITVIE